MYSPEFLEMLRQQKWDRALKVLDVGSPHRTLAFFFEDAGFTVVDGICRDLTNTMHKWSADRYDIVIYSVVEEFYEKSFPQFLQAKWSGKGPAWIVSDFYPLYDKALDGLRDSGFTVTAFKRFGNHVYALSRSKTAGTAYVGIPPIVPRTKSKPAVVSSSEVCDHSLMLHPIGRDRFEARCYKCSCRLEINGCTLSDGNITIMAR